MGNTATCCGGRRDQRSYGFREQDLEQLSALFRKLIDSQPETKGGSEFNRKALFDYFEENPEMGNKLYKFMKYHTKRPTDKTRGIDFDTFLATLEVLTGENSDWHLRQYKKLGKHLLLAVIWSENHNLIDEKNFKEAVISYPEALDLVKCILSMFPSEKTKTPEPQNDAAAKSLIDGVFGTLPKFNSLLMASLSLEGHEGGIDWWSFLHHIRQNLIHLSPALLIYFESKFLNKPLRLKLPEISYQSAFLTKDVLALFALSNIHVRDAAILRLIYSSQGRHNFERFATALKHPGGTLILVSHSDGQGGKTKTPVVFGAFANKPWTNNALYSDDDRSYIFSLFPKFQNFFHRSRTGENVQTNFTYLNTERQRSNHVGLGLGGTEDGEFRFWLDVDINAHSYVTNEDGTYEKGYIVPSSVKQLNIDTIEIWGLESSAWTSNVATPTMRNSQIGRTSTLNRQSIIRPSMSTTKVEFRKTETTIMENLAALDKDRPSVTEIRRPTTTLLRNSKVNLITPKDTENVRFNNIDQDNTADDKSPVQGAYFNPKDNTSRFLYQPANGKASSSQK